MQHIQNSRDHELVIGERVGGPPLVIAAVSRTHEEAAPAAELVKVEPVAQGVLAHGVSQPLVDAVNVTAAGLEATAVQPRRARRQRSVAREFVLSDFPPNECEVLTPREPPLGNTWLPVVGNRDGYLTVKNEEGGEEKLSMLAVNRLAAQEGVVQRPSRAVWSPAAAPAAASPPAPAAAPPPAPAAAPPPAAPQAALQPVAPRPTLPQQQPPPAALGVAGGGIRVVKVEEIENARLACAGAQPNETTLRMRALRDAYLHEPAGAPRAGQPRYVFKKGTTPPAINTVMGGNGSHVYPKMVTPRPAGLVRAGEIYFVGRRDFNPWAPSFAGDPYGFLELWGIPEGQKEFHVFGNCCKQHEDPFRPCHGAAAAGRYVYCGVYMFDEELPAESLTFVQMESMGKAQRSRVEWLFEHTLELGLLLHADWREIPGETKTTFRSQAELVAHLKAHGYYLEADRLDGEAEPVSGIELDYRALHRYLERRNPTYWRQPVKFVRYDEGVYRALVNADAMGKDKNGNPIAVETDIGNLGYV